MEYRIVNCLGDDNIRKAIDDAMQEDTGWRVHTLIPNGALEVEMSHITQEKMMVPNFMLLFEREDIGPHLKRLS